MAINERQLALDVLIEIYDKQGYSNLSLYKMLPQGRGNQRQKNSFVTALVYGVVERDITLEYVINSYIKKPFQKLDLEIQLILKMGFYQLLYLDGVPENAAVDESVKLCYYVKKVSAKGFVNGVLRSFLRDGKKLVIRESDDLKSLSIAYSCPLWLIQKWVQEYSYEQTKKFLQASLGRPPLCIRVNTLKTNSQILGEQLKQKQIHVEENQYLKNCFSIFNTGNLERISQFRQGEFYVQDIASQLCAALVDPKPGERVFDICAAPGSKSFTMAQLMQNQGEIISFDLYDHKLKLIEDGAKKLGITNITARKGDGRIYYSDLGTADRVLCDVPCSGLGIIRRKPEIKYKPKEAIDVLPEIQYEILQNASRYVKPGGRLVYSTCALNKAENQNVANRFLQEHEEFLPEILPEELKMFGILEKNMLTLMPQFLNSDGFFIAVFQRKGDLSKESI